MGKGVREKACRRQLKQPILLWLSWRILGLEQQEKHWKWTDPEVIPLYASGNGQSSNTCHKESWPCRYETGPAAHGHNQKHSPKVELLSVMSTAEKRSSGRTGAAPALRQWKLEPLLITAPECLCFQWWCGLCPQNIFCTELFHMCVCVCTGEQTHI